MAASVAWATPRIEGGVVVGYRVRLPTANGEVLMDLSVAQTRRLVTAGALPPNDIARTVFYACPLDATGLALLPRAPSLGPAGRVLVNSTLRCTEATAALSEGFAPGALAWIRRAGYEAEIPYWIPEPHAAAVARLVPGAVSRPT